MELKIMKDRVLEAAASCEDARRVLRILFPEVFGVNRTYKAGDKFRYEDGEEYKLVSVDGESFIFVSLQNWKAWDVPEPVDDISAITHDELKDHLGDSSVDRFTLIEE